MGHTCMEFVQYPYQQASCHIVHPQMLKVTGDTMGGVNLAFLIISAVNSGAFIVNSIAGATVVISTVKRQVQ